MFNELFARLPSNRDRALVAFWISTGARASELLGAVGSRDGAWTQRYEHGIPVTGLVPIPGTSATGTTVHFRPDQTIRASGTRAVIDAVQLAASWPQLSVDIRQEQDS